MNEEYQVMEIFFLQQFEQSKMICGNKMHMVHCKIQVHSYLRRVSHHSEEKVYNGIINTISEETVAV